MVNTLDLLLKNMVTTTVPNIRINKIELDSRNVFPGDLFIAYHGTHVDSRDYISDAIENGAVAILKESDDADDIIFQNSIPIISIPNLPQKISEIASIFYNDPSSKMTVIGITGTNGKTSCCHLIAEALTLMSQRKLLKNTEKIGVLGTVGNGLFGHLDRPHLTTPDPVTVQKILNDFVQKGVKTVVMEASSHALDQGRVAAVKFDLGAYTNLTYEHLDYHHSMEEYAKAKRILFDMPSLKYAVLNLDDEIGAQWSEDYQKRLSVCGYSIREEKNQRSIPTAIAKNIVLKASGITADLMTPWGDGKLISRLLGRFNVSNLLAVIAVLGLLNYSLKDILEVVTDLTPVTGRMQTFGGKDQALVVVDFAHTPDALKQALSALKEHCEGELYCVFGCGGDRDRGKRPQMAEIAEQVADRVILTDDNVRTEDPDQIFSEILKGFLNPEKVQIEHDRTKAIQLAIEQATSSDIILIAGKGHEDYQIIGNHKIHLSDIETVQSFL